MNTRKLGQWESEYKKSEIPLSSATKVGTKLYKKLKANHIISTTNFLISLEKRQTNYSTEFKTHAINKKEN